MAVDAHLLERILRWFPADAEASLAMDSSQLVLTMDNSRYELSTLPAEDFPADQPVKRRADVKADGVTLWRALEMVAPSISTEETRYYLNGVLFDKTDRQTVRLVASDGHRLSVAALAAAGQWVLNPNSTIVTRAAVRVLRKIRPRGEVVIRFDGERACFMGDGWRLTSKLIDGVFPNYEPIISQTDDPAITLKFERRALLQATGRAGVMFERRGRAMKVSIEPEGLTFSASDPDRGVSVVRAPFVERSSDQQMAVGFNPLYLADIAKASSAEFVELSLTGAGSPARLDCGQGQFGC